MQYWLIFLTGLTTGGVSCLAVQGGLLAATLANTAEHKDKLHNAVPTLVFLVTKLVAYTMLGLLLGWFGSVFQLNTTAKIVFQLVAAVMMLGLAANMLELHPVFRYFVIQPPKWVGRLLRNQTKSQSLFAPEVLGIFTVLIPCGVTQAMEILAVSSGSPWSGALIMFSFVLGTSPIFLVLGWLTTKFSENFRRRFFKAAAVLVIFIALSSFNGALVLAGSNYTFDNWVWAFRNTFLNSAPVGTISQDVTIAISSGGYTPNNFSVRVNQPVTLTLVSKNVYSCALQFTIPKLGIVRNLKPDDRQTVTFTPTQTGPLAFSCGMGMYTGTINVIL